jgi:UbiD family decarboxylase
LHSAKDPLFTPDAISGIFAVKHRSILISGMCAESTQSLAKEFPAQPPHALIQSNRKMSFRNLREFIKQLKDSGELRLITREVDPFLELAEVHRRVIAQAGPALFFEKVKGSPFPVVTNLFGTERRIEMAFGTRPSKLVRDVARLISELIPLNPAKLWAQRDLLWQSVKLGTRKVNRGPILDVKEEPPDLNQLPIITCWPKDGGPFVTLPLVYTEHPVTRQHNLGMYRLQRHSTYTTGMHWQIHKGGGFHYSIAEKLNRPLPVSVFLGGPPALMLAAIAPLPENVGEMMVASLLAGERLPLVRPTVHAHPIPAEAEFVLQGQVPPHLRMPEGPFGDHYGYYSLRHDYPVFQVERIYRRQDAIYPATVVGRPCQEDYFIGNYLQELFAPLFPLIMPGVRQLWTYAQTGFHSLAAAVVEERYEREAMVSVFRILGEGQLSLTKVLLAVNTPLDLRDFPQLLTHILARVRWETDLMIFSKLSMDTLDYCGPEINKGSKAVILALGEPIRDLPRHFQGLIPGGIRQVEVYGPGCLVLEMSYSQPGGFELEDICRWADFFEWPLLILVDDASIARSDVDFLWTVFTRFDPASDIYAAKTNLYKHQIRYQGPILIDSRMKPSYPEVLASAPEIDEQVEARWSDYFESQGKME